MFGMLDYFAPEVFTEQLVSTSIDLWVLVVSVMELYYGAHPFDPKSWSQVAKNIKFNKLNFLWLFFNLNIVTHVIRKTVLTTHTLLSKKATMRGVTP
ncbi:hypothetical protein B4U79_18405 [Dinothrombium tinctorium]|uniref:Protein kinase domain-containing protein n=1 Tax=Dinothrombium tinctorium TaxID=1965070 RepID=A0A443QL33_9ACAR|nr:hypothetical protein B4U79_18405 [Dinothrombium tinctorium]